MPDVTQNLRPLKSSIRPRDLTREKVIEAGLGLLDRDGVDAVTMRAVAESLKVTPMALYNHVSGKDDLLRAIAAHVLDKANFNGSASDWRAQMVFCFREIRAVCLRHPGLSRLLETADIAPATVFAPMEVTLKALGQAGISELDSVRTYFTLVSFTIMQTAYQSRGPYIDLEPTERTPVPAHCRARLQGARRNRTATRVGFRCRIRVWTRPHSRWR